MCRHPGPSFPPAPSSTKRRHRGSGATVCVAPGDGLRWASMSWLLVMLVSSMGRRFGSFKADPARTTCSGRPVRFVISSFLAKGTMICASPWDFRSGPSVWVAPAMGSWARRSEEGGVAGGVFSSPARLLLMCPSGRRCVRESAPWRWLMQRDHVLELLGGKMRFPRLGGAGGRRCPPRKMTLEGLIVIFCFLRGFFVIWGCTVLDL